MPRLKPPRSRAILKHIVDADEGGLLLFLDEILQGFLLLEVLGEILDYHEVAVDICGVGRDDFFQTDDLEDGLASTLVILALERS